MSESVSYPERAVDSRSSRTACPAQRPARAACAIRPYVVGFEPGFGWGAGFGTGLPSGTGAGLLGGAGVGEGFGCGVGCGGCGV